MSKRMTEQELAAILRKDLSNDSLVRYYDEQLRMIFNEIEYGRSTQLYEFRFDAAYLAMQMPEPEIFSRYR